MKLLYLLLFSFPIFAQANLIELEITSKWTSKKTQDVLLTLVYVESGKTVDLALEGKPKTFLNITAKLDGKDVILTTKISEKKEGSVKVLLDKTTRAKLNKKNIVSGKTKDDGIELEIIPALMK